MCCAVLSHSVMTGLFSPTGSGPPRLPTRNKSEGCAVIRTHSMPGPRAAALLTAEAVSLLLNNVSYSLCLFYNLL